jgi:hypothetical protein
MIFIVASLSNKVGYKKASMIGEVQAEEKENAEECMRLRRGPHSPCMCRNRWGSGNWPRTHPPQNGAGCPLSGVVALLEKTVAGSTENQQRIVDRGCCFGRIDPVIDQ